MVKKIIWFSGIFFLITVGIGTCYQFEVKESHYPTASQKAFAGLPTELRISTAKNIFVKYDMDSTDHWVRMTLSDAVLSSIADSLHPIVQLSKRQKWGVCNANENWWSEDLCNTSGNVSLHQIDVPAPYKAALPSIAVVGLDQKNNFLYFYNPPNRLK